MESAGGWLNDVWFVLIAVLVLGYALLDGFDLGVGMLHLFVRSDEERQILIRSIAPVWDGNEVWLLAAGGALFAAFPVAYATLLSGFYLAIMLLLLALIARAVSLEFRNAHTGPRWRSLFDVGFGVGSFLAAFLLGVAGGNILRGVPVGPGATWAGSFGGLLNPYALLTGILVVATCALHGTAWLMLKTPPELGERMARVAHRLSIVVMVLFGLSAAGTPLFAPHLIGRAAGRPLAFGVAAILVIGGFAGTLLWSRRGRPGWTFGATSVLIVGMVLLAALSLFPVIVHSTLNPHFSLTVENAASNPYTLAVMLIITGLGMPLVLGYTVFIYALFRGKVTAKEVQY